MEKKTSGEVKDLFYSSTVEYPNEKNDRILRNSLLFPISKAFLEDYPQYFDMLKTYENAIEAIPNMIENDKDSVLDTFLPINDTETMHLKVNITNSRLYSPITQEAVKYGNVLNMITPKTALAKQATYFLWLVGDINYSFIIIDNKKIDKDLSYIETLNEYVSILNKENYISGKVEDGYVVGIPLMIGSKWDSLRNFDIGSLVKSGEEMFGFYGTFCIEGYLRYLVPCLKKPINKPIVLHNDFDNQLSRVEIQYSKNTQDYQNSYYMVGAMLQPSSIKIEGVGKSIECNEFGFSLQLNHPTMNVISSTEKIKALINFIPMKILFAAFGRVTDADLIDFVCSDYSNIGLITTIKLGNLYGPKLHSALIKAEIKLEQNEQNYIKMAEPLTTDLARYIIGMNIMKQEVINDLRIKSKGDVQTFRFLIKSNVDEILRERFMPAIGDPETGSNVDRDTAICVTLGNIFNKLYVVGIDKRQEQSKQSLTNKRYFCGQSFIKEFKAFHGHRLNIELVPAIKNLFVSSKTSKFNSLVFDAINSVAKQMSIAQTKSLITSFKGTGVKQQNPDVRSKFRNELVDPKNQIFIWNKLREVQKNASSEKRDVRDSWENRRVNPSEMFFLCPTESPDSANVMKFRALGVHSKITSLSPSKPILKFLYSNPKFRKTIENDKIKEYYTVSINGSIVGYLHEFDDVENCYNELMKLRRIGNNENYLERYSPKVENDKIPNDLTVILNHILGELSIWSDGGRITVPFVNVENSFNFTGNKLSPKKEFLNWLAECDREVGMFIKGINEGFIEFLDSEMIANNMVIAGCIRDFYENPLKYTHIALSASADGIVVAANPCANLNVGIRSGMATNHLKQAMGYPLSKYPQLTFMKNMDILVNAQQPLVQPAIYKYLHLDQVPIGQNVTICFIQYVYNQDDSVIFNRESVENGLLKCDTFTTFESNTLKNDEQFAIPNKNTVKDLIGNPFSYDKLGEDSCLPKSTSTLFYTGDVLIGKIKKTDVGTADISELNKMPDAQKTINPRPMRSVERHYIHGKDTKNKMVVTGQYRVPISGDKVNLEQGQKQTVGKVIDPERLPYTSSGMRADVYFNPLSVFKRKTYGCLYLATLMKIAALYGCILENSSYGTCRTVEEVEELFKNMEINPQGFEEMYDPETGCKIGTGIYFGMSYYERQHHLTESKINVRCKGSKDSTYLMPTRGKKIGGGLTVDGKLSLNALNSSGANFISKDFHLNQCSKMEVGFCQICHSVSCFKIYGDKGNNSWCCPTCGKHDKIIPRFVSCSFPLLNHIFNGLHLALNYYDEGFD